MSAATGRLPQDVTLLERGWLSSNSVLLRGDPRGAVIIDTGYCTHKAQTLALVEAELGAEALRLIVNTHLHSDHCGGNARLAERFTCPIWTPAGQFQAAADWDEARLSYRPTGQQCERFLPARALHPGESIDQAGRHWQALAAPGHDPNSLILFEPDGAVLISADALWEHGFGIVFPELDSDGGFDEVEATLDLIESLEARLVIPGHGSAFSDVQAALAEARARLAFFRLNPNRHARHAAKALIKYHMLEVQRQPLRELLLWLAETPIHRQIWSLYFSSMPLEAWSRELLEELLRAGVLCVRGDIVHDH
jgi:glyoxylase-like metal-dependent hydrolase (beta-lactamase superfamily II)